MQDVITWINSKRGKKQKRRFSYSPAKSLLRYVVLALFVVALVAGIGSLLYFTALPTVWAYLIPILCLYAFFIGFGVFYFLYDSVKDGKGELLR